MSEISNVFSILSDIIDSSTVLLDQQSMATITQAHNLNKNDTYRPGEHLTGICYVPILRARRMELFQKSIYLEQYIFCVLCLIPSSNVLLVFTTGTLKVPPEVQGCGSNIIGRYFFNDGFCWSVSHQMYQCTCVFHSSLSIPAPQIPLTTYCIF